MTNEVPKRLAPTSETVRELFLKSGNLCAFPLCSHLLMNAEGVFISQICHIEAADEGGQRFNKVMSNEDRRAFSNLMLMCHAHHKITDDVDKYSVADLKDMKAAHEARFSSPERVILDSIQDWTKSYRSTVPENLGKFLQALGHTMAPDELKDFLKNFKKYIKKFQLIPLEMRHFFSEAILRMQRMSDTPVVVDHHWGTQAIHTADLEKAFQLSKSQFFEKVQELEMYGIASIDEIEDFEYRVKPVFIVHPIDEWPFWCDLALYCEKRGIDLKIFTHDMQFSQLDLDQSAK